MHKFSLIVMLFYLAGIKANTCLHTDLVVPFSDTCFLINESNSSWYKYQMPILTPSLQELHVYVNGIDTPFTYNNNMIQILLQYTNSYPAIVCFTSVDKYTDLCPQCMCMYTLINNFPNDYCNYGIIGNYCNNPSETPPTINYSPETPETPETPPTINYSPETPPETPPTINYSPETPPETPPTINYSPETPPTINYSPETPPTIPFPYCHCGNQPSQLSLLQYSNCFKLTISDQCPNTTSPCCLFQLAKIEIETHISCYGSVIYSTVNGVKKPPFFQSKPGPSVKITNLNNIPTPDLEICLVLRPPCSTLTQLCNGPNCSYALFGIDSCCTINRPYSRK